MIKILIIEDHNILIEGIKELLSKEASCSIVYEALDGESGLAKVENCPDIDLVLLDINLPDMPGMEVCTRIRKIAPDLPILTLTMHASTSYLREMINAGANGYILKDASTEELIEAIHSVVNGKLFLSHRVKEMLNNDINKTPIDQNKKIPPLTARETEILRYIIAEYTTDEIASKLFISSHTVISHRKNLLKKMNVKNTAGIVKTAYERRLLD